MSDSQIQLLNMMQKILQKYIYIFSNSKIYLCILLNTKSIYVYKLYT